MSAEAEFEPDRVEGAPHPRQTDEVIGQDPAATAFLEAFRAGRLHHAWLLTGPRGVGKATLAWKIAAFLAAGAETTDTLKLPADHPVGARIKALSEPRVFLMRPGRNPETGTERKVITVDVARRLRDHLSLSAADGGRRAVIVDAADDLNPQAANAILKLVEEPPARTTFLMVSHAPARLLPTIRSRCRTLPCTPLAPPDLAAALAQAGLAPEVDPATLAQLAGGSVGEAARLLHLDGPDLYVELVETFAACPDLDRQRLLALAEGLGGTAGQARLDALVGLVALMLSRLARYGAGVVPDAEAAPGEAEMLARLAPHPEAGRIWADLHQSAGARMAHGRAVNLDPQSLVLDTGLTINETGRGILRG